MNYQFPKIATIDDVLPHLEGYDEFVVAKKKFGNTPYTVINYAVSMPETFKMEGPNDLSGAIRRECRGLIFDADGKLISRPYHKFFNMNEKPETQESVLDFNRPHRILDKLDGSMVRPFRLGDQIVFGTKMGVTDVSLQMAENVDLYLDRMEWIKYALNLGYTPIFEYVGPDNQIVVRYNEPKLILTAIRHNLSGVYLGLGKDYYTPFDQVESLDSLYSVNDDNVEGNVIRFDDGHMVKVKLPWYVQLHKIKENFCFDRHIISAAFDSTLDDAIAALPNVDRDRILEVEKDFWNLYTIKRNVLDTFVHGMVEKFNGDKKALATQVVPNLRDKMIARFLFSVADGKDFGQVFREHVKAQLGSNVKYDAMMNWLNDVRF